ncbi:DUF1328 domain-containing protein [Mesorhizobium sp. RP14(2022)]|jgi:uncharacterized membrane protein YtjA (UPF0391 family)|uniref:UPF0391 membrane protein NGM99_15090 n=1 Tax=Mesorhizobium liriopis TaxID=2953882 RepID=A0ABT1C8D5_9HYPH|nr:DUF1328 family protein [Mesorhizobium liriopis]MCO6051108.1 DUF1328 domain-containing protein [Mesorhizobium liriopis]
MGDLVKWILILAVVAVVAGWLGFGGVSRIAGGGAKILLAILVIGIILIGLLFYFAAGSIT